MVLALIGTPIYLVKLVLLLLLHHEILLILLVVRGIKLLLLEKHILLVLLQVGWLAHPLLVLLLLHQDLLLEYHQILLTHLCLRVDYGQAFVTTA